MRPLFRARFLLALGIVAALVNYSPVRAQGADRVKFETADGVELHGKFYPGKGSKSPTVILLHNIGSNTQEDGWDRLATKLQETCNCAVLSFDFRGHGDSQAVQPSFWTKPHNAQVRGNAKKESISFKDYGRGYYPVLVNDIAAAKVFLDRRNDEGQCNSRSIILIGAQDGAVLGTMWLASELHRYQIIAQLPLLKLDDRPEGKSVVACVWLSMTGQSFWPNLTEWLQIEGKNFRVPMAFVYGAEDATSATFAKKWAKELKSDSGPTKKFTGEEGIKKSKAQGNKLLFKELDTVKFLTTYVKDVTEAITPPDYSKIEFEKKGYAWRANGRVITAKLPDEKMLREIPAIIWSTR